MECDPRRGIYYILVQKLLFRDILLFDRGVRFSRW